MKEKLGCWSDDFRQENSFQAYYRIHLSGDVEAPLDPGQTITYPLIDKMDLTDAMKLRLKDDLQQWTLDVKTYFNQNTGWKSGAPIRLKEMGVLITCLGTSGQEPGLASTAKALADSIVHYIYTAELTNNQ